MKCRGLIKGLVVALILVGVFATFSAAEESAAGTKHPVAAPGGFMAPTLEGPWRTMIALSLWAPTTVKFGVETEEQSETIHEDLDWLLDVLDYEIPIEAEVRKGSFGIYAHLLAFKISGDLDVGPATLEWDDQGFLLDIGVSYQLGQWALGTGARPPTLTVEPFAGARLLYDPVDIEVDLGPEKDSTSIKLSNYVPSIGLRAFVDLTEHWNLRMDFDYGGFGVDDNHETWNWRALAGYRFSGWGVGWNIQGGYRSMKVMELRKSDADVKIYLDGPIALVAVEF